jgi:hypothetical protein
MPAYTISVFGEDHLTVAEMPAVAPNAQAALDAAQPWVRQVVARAGILPLWSKAVPHPIWEARITKPLSAKGRYA